MKEKDLFQAIEDTDDHLIEQSEKHVSVRWIKWIALAAGIILVSVLTIYFFTKTTGPSDENVEALPPGIVVDGVTYYISSWDISEAVLPAGFSYVGVVDSVTTDGKYLLDSEYFTNAEIPEWIYVYGKTWVSTPQGEIESLVYIRFVTGEARFHDLLYLNGRLFESLWSFQSDDRDQLTEKYGLRIENLPDGCVLAGSAFLEELDRIPGMELGVNNKNYDGAKVYVNGNDDNAIYVSTSWYTSTETEGKETLHNGYDVFVRQP